MIQLSTPEYTPWGNSYTSQKGWFKESIVVVRSPRLLVTILVNRDKKILLGYWTDLRSDGLTITHM